MAKNEAQQEARFAFALVDLLMLQESTPMSLDRETRWKDGVLWLQAYGDKQPLLFFYEALRIGENGAASIQMRSCTSPEPTDLIERAVKGKLVECCAIELGTTIHTVFLSGKIASVDVGDFTVSEMRYIDITWEEKHREGV